MSGSRGSEQVVSHSPAHGRSGSRSQDVGASSARTGHPNHVLPVIDADASPRPDVVPDHLVFQVPAHLGFIGQIGSALEGTLALIDRDPVAGTDLGAAVLTTARSMIGRARPWTPLELSIAIDDADVFVRLSATLLDPDEPEQLGEHVRATLHRNVESHEVLHEGGTMFAVLQVPLEPRASR